MNKQQVIEGLTKDIVAKMGADMAAGQLKYDYGMIVAHWVNQLTGIPEKPPNCHRRNE